MLVNVSSVRMREGILIFDVKCFGAG
jgi:hypothetical protein